MSNRPPELVPIGLTVWKDIEGYEEVDRGERPISEVLAMEGSYGRHIVGKSGKYVPVEYILGESVGPVWEEAARVRSTYDLTEFIGRRGPLECFLPGGKIHTFGTFREAKKYGAPYYRAAATYDRPRDGVARFFEAIRKLAEFVNLNKRDDFVSAIGGRIRRVELSLFLNDRPMSLEVPSLYEYLVYEMLSEFGSTPPASSGLRVCANPNCSNTIFVGGRRGVGRRSDTRYCSAKCKVAASRLRRRQTQI